MENFSKKDHWENIYQTKALENVSWYQPVPQTSLDFIAEFNLPKSAKIMDAGGGDSFFAEHLLQAGYNNVSVLDISEAALERAKQRLGGQAELINWIVSDVSAFQTQEKYDFWHDRAVFHFLTEDKDLDNYLKVLSHAIKPGGILVIGTFSENGPLKCSGIPIRQYSEASLTERLSEMFVKVKCLNADHQTPFDTTQNFTFCSFRRRNED